MRVKAARVSAWDTSISTLFGLSPKFTIECGNRACGFVWRTRTAVMDNPTAMCPACRAVNIIPARWGP